MQPKDGGELEMLKPLVTARLRLRELTANDAPFIVALLNDPAFIENIADREVRTIEDAIDYLEKGPIASYARHAFGLLAVDRQCDECTIGLCGLVRRPGLSGPDLGYAFLPEARGQGYATEAGAAILRDVQERLPYRQIFAVFNPSNTRSARVVEKLGFGSQQFMRLPGEDRDSLLVTYTFDSHAPIA